MAQPMIGVAELGVRSSIMKYFFAITFLSLQATVAKDIGYIFGTEHFYVQEAPDLSKLSPGGSTPPKGTVTSLHLGVYVSNKAADLQITDDRVLIKLLTPPIELTAKDKNLFVNSEIVTLPSGFKVQYFKTKNTDHGQLVIYDKLQRLVRTIDLLKAGDHSSDITQPIKTEQGAAANP
jgi:hypothetical protein